MASAATMPALRSESTIRERRDIRNGSGNVAYGSGSNNGGSRSPASYTGGSSAPRIPSASSRPSAPSTNNQQPKAAHDRHVTFDQDADAKTRAAYRASERESNPVPNQQRHQNHHQQRQQPRERGGGGGGNIVEEEEEHRYSLHQDQQQSREHHQHQNQQQQQHHERQRDGRQDATDRKSLPRRQAPSSHQSQAALPPTQRSQSAPSPSSSLTSSSPAAPPSSRSDLSLATQPPPPPPSHPTIAVADFKKLQSDAARCIIRSTVALFIAIVLAAAIIYLIRRIGAIHALLKNQTPALTRAEMLEACRYYAQRERDGLQADDQPNESEHGNPRDRPADGDARTSPLFANGNVARSGASIFFTTSAEGFAAAVATPATSVTPTTTQHAPVIRNDVVGSDRHGGDRASDNRFGANDDNNEAPTASRNRVETIRARTIGRRDQLTSFREHGASSYGDSASISRSGIPLSSVHQEYSDIANGDDDDDDGGGGGDCQRDASDAGSLEDSDRLSRETLQHLYQLQERQLRYQHKQDYSQQQSYREHQQRHGSSSYHQLDQPNYNDGDNDGYDVYPGNVDQARHQWQQQQQNQHQEQQERDQDNSQRTPPASQQRSEYQSQLQSQSHPQSQSYPQAHERNDHHPYPSSSNAVDVANSQTASNLNPSYDAPIDVPAAMVYGGDDDDGDDGQGQFPFKQSLPSLPSPSLLSRLSSPSLANQISPVPIPVPVSVPISVPVLASGTASENALVLPDISEAFETSLLSLTQSSSTANKTSSTRTTVDIASAADAKSSGTTLDHAQTVPYVPLMKRSAPLLLRNAAATTHIVDSRDIENSDNEDDDNSDDGDGGSDDNDDPDDGNDEDDNERDGKKEEGEGEKERTALAQYSGDSRPNNEFIEITANGVTCRDDADSTNDNPDNNKKMDGGLSSPARGVIVSHVSADPNGFTLDGKKNVNAFSKGRTMENVLLNTHNVGSTVNSNGNDKSERVVKTATSIQENEFISFPLDCTSNEKSDTEAYAVCSNDSCSINAADSADAAHTAISDTKTGINQ